MYIHVSFECTQFNYSYVHKKSSRHKFGCKSIIIQVGHRSALLGPFMASTSVSEWCILTLQRIISDLADYNNGRALQQLVAFREAVAAEVLHEGVIPITVVQLWTS